MKNILLIGEGRIARAVAFFLRKFSRNFCVRFLKKKADALWADLLIAALPGPQAKDALFLAIHYKKNLIDISDLDPPFYRRYKKDILRRGVLVVPECGFSPGLVNLLLEEELGRHISPFHVEIKTGSFSSEEGIFPFLWCFEDLIAEHRLPSWQRLNSVNRKAPPFYGYQKEKWGKRNVETYYCASGFEQFLSRKGIRHFTTRVIRPLGFYAFFRMLERYGFLDGANSTFTRSILEKQVLDNYTVGEIKVEGKKSCGIWKISAFSRKKEKLNSMQKMTAALPSFLAKEILNDRFSKKGLVFPEALANEQAFGQDFWAKIEKYGIKIKRFCCGKNSQNNRKN